MIRPRAVHALGGLRVAGIAREQFVRGDGARIVARRSDEAERLADHALRVEEDEELRQLAVHVRIRLRVERLEMRRGLCARRRVGLAEARECELVRAQELELMVEIQLRKCDAVEPGEDARLELRVLRVRGTDSAG